MRKLILFSLFLSIMAMTVAVHGGQKLTILRGQDFPPYHFLDQTGRENGFLIDIITQVGKALDLEIKFEQYPWSRCLHLVKTGQADAMMNLFKTIERTEFMYFFNNILTHEVNRFFKLKSSPVSFTGDLASLGDIRIGGIRNYSYGKVFDETIGLNILRLETEKALVLNLASQRCDIILGNEIVLQTLASQIMPGKKIIPTGPGITNDPLYIGFSKAREHKDLATDFSRELNLFKASQAHKDILKHYGL